MREGQNGRIRRYLRGRTDPARLYVPAVGQRSLIPRQNSIRKYQVKLMHVHINERGNSVYVLCVLILFFSGTGWPSFATGLPGVEIENVNPVQMSLAGAELRCATCGGHLGDVFNDGKLFLNTPAFKSGQRYCIDGAALIFKPADGTSDVYGDTPPPSSKGELPSFLQPPKINAR